jgi:hypothetical protein
MLSIWSNEISGTVGTSVNSNSNHIIRHSLLINSVLILILLLTSLSAHAQISPGKLTTAHESMEGITNCTQCHELGKAVSPDKCLECHQSLKRRIDAERGYHSTSDVTQKSCTKCHSEHHGRDYELVFWPSGQTEFDHNATGWTFSGKHNELECNRCHRTRFHRWAGLSRDESINEDHTFLGLDKNCIACHEDEHGDQLKNDCLTCHNESEWKPAPGFVHNRDAEYILTGKHLDLECVKCHELLERSAADQSLLVHADSPLKYSKYVDLPFASCASCHREPHNGRLGEKCIRCHTTDGFNSILAVEGFDHNRTRFPLIGLHQKVDCNKCHTAGKMTDSVAYETCASCHRDEHRGQFAERQDGGRCDACHTAEKPFNRHNYSIADHKQSTYELTGSHLAIPCVLCHVQEEVEDGGTYALFNYPDTRCQACHKDEHRGQLDIWINDKGCEYCHSTATWHQTSFDHDQARFKLEGKHREILCLKCHWIETEEGEELVWMKPLEMVCVGCHDDPHGAQFASNGQDLTCEGCHQPAEWKSLLFKHDIDTKFPLAGGHENVACAKCHFPLQPDGTATIQYRGTTKECKACHGSIPKTSGSG